jgi:hypothetical protein
VDEQNKNQDNDDGYLNVAQREYNYPIYYHVRILFQTIGGEKNVALSYGQKYIEK